MDLPRNIARLLESGNVGRSCDRDGQPLLAGVVLKGDVQGAVLAEGLGLVGGEERRTRTILNAQISKKQLVTFVALGDQSLDTKQMEPNSHLWPQNSSAVTGDVLIAGFVEVTFCVLVPAGLTGATGTVTALWGRHPPDPSLRVASRRHAGPRVLVLVWRRLRLTE